ncbi:Er membrane protein complex subunit [Thalictrum thalictroides]|uniref:ER membrane protein complex subunit 1 n=1 Tax=Thalictrum thalictroides TaxID=46969 RepID=A0A7J6XEZ2_THATH|nr:Er membrane protein complex subunit [Thalictrum thalictroides]
MAIRVSLTFFFLFISLNLSSALYEDQVGLMDWHHKYIGKVKQAVFHTQKAGRKRVIVSTEENVIASLDLRRGEIFWRHVLARNDVIDAIDITLGKYVITLSSEGSVVRAWNLPDGQMIWESFLQGSTPSKSFLSIPVNLKIDKDNIIIVFGQGCLYAISSIDGEVLWTKQFTSESLEIQQVFQPVDSDIIYAIGFVGSLKFVSYQINANSGEVIKQSDATFPGGFSGDLAYVSSDTLVALDSTRSILVSLTLQDGDISLHQTHVSDLVEGLFGISSILPSKHTDMFSVKSSSVTVFIRVTGGGNLEVLEKVSQPSAVSDSLAILEGQQAFALVQLHDNKVHLTVKFDNDWSSDLIKERIEIDQQRGLVQKVFINSYIRTDKSYGFRALIVMEDHSLLLLQQGEIVWSREDGLASIIDTSTSELPFAKEGVSVAKVEHNLFEWLKGHVLKLKGTLMLASPDDIVAIQGMRLKNSEKTKMTRDHNGFRKLLIVLTRAGKLYALHTGDGRVVWSVLLPSLRRSDACESPSGLNLYQWQVPHHHAMDENPSVLIVGRCGHGPDAPGVLSFVDSYTGKELSSSSLTHSIAQVIPLPFTDSTEQRLHLLIDAGNRAFLYPRTPEAIDIFEKERPNMYWYSIDDKKNIIKGYALQHNCIEASDSYCFNTKEVWSIIFPTESEKIIACATRKSNEVVHTQAKVVADHDLMYKYISKNLLFTATVAPKAAGEVGSVTPEESWLVVYLIDSITGRILHRVTHHGSQGPVHAVFSENWVVYHYFNLRAHRYEMSVIEIYDQSRADNKDVWKLILGKHNLTAPVSSYSRPEVVVKSQSYFFTHSLKTMAATSTAKGITSKQLLIGTIGDQVLALDKRFVDPRRSLNPTQAEKEEGILPLTDALPIIPQSYISHSIQVEGLRHIITVPAKLESTSLVFAYGVDLFFTRIAPSRTYDSLTEDFSYALLLLTIIGLVAAIFVTWVLSEKKDLRDKWR